MTRIRSPLATILAAMLAGLASPAPAADDPAAEANRRLGRGINLGNALEAPSEGEWGMILDASFFKEIAEAGFDSVRIPIRWSAHAAKEPPYAIDPGFFERVDWAIDQAIANGLAAVVNFHHIEELYEDPDAERERFLALWGQVAERYRDRPESVGFEILNEPHGDLDADSWNALIPEALAVIRASNPDRVVVVGPADWNGFRALDSLQLPEGDRRLIATFHYYEPFRFTHQGAEWVEDSEPWLGTEWTGSEREEADVVAAFDRVASWAREHGRPVYLGEFGAYGKADMESRARWTAFVAREAERRGFSWSYWEFGSGFGAFDRRAGRWRAELLGALIPGPDPADRP